MPLELPFALKTCSRKSWLKTVLFQIVVLNRFCDLDFDNILLFLGSISAALSCLVYPSRKERGLISRTAAGNRAMLF